MTTPPVTTGVRTPAPSQAQAPGVTPAMAPSAARAPAAERAADLVVEGLANEVLFDRPTADGPLWALGHTWKASFDGSGFEYIPFFGSQAPRNFPLRVELTGAQVGGEPLALPAGRPERQGFAVRTGRGALTEVVELGVRQVEQSFVFESLPNRGAVAVDVRLDGEFASATVPGGLRFANAHGHVDYTKAVAVDAAGRRLPLPIAWNGTAARIEIPADFVAAAKLPLVLDPVLATTASLAGSTAAAQAQSKPDVASIPTAGGRSLVVWLRQWSANDQDCYARLTDLDLAPLGPTFTLDFTNLDWLAPAVAGSAFGQNFLAVSEIRNGSQHYIGGRIVPASGGPLPLFDIERSGFVGLAGNNFRPDVGSDPYNGALAYYCVVFEKNVGTNNNDIYCKLVQQDGTLLTTNPIALDTGSNNQANPTISKSNGTNAWLTAWQSQYQFTPFDYEIYGSVIDWSGTVLHGPIGLATSVADETNPAASSPLLSGTADLRAVAWEYANLAGQLRDIALRTVDAATGAVSQPFLLSSAESPASFQTDQAAPDIDSDGIRLVVAYTDQNLFSPFDTDTLVSTVAVLPNGSYRLDETRAALGASANNFELSPSVCAMGRVGPNGANTRYAIVDSITFMGLFGNITSTDIQAYVYDGVSPGAYFTLGTSGCGGATATLTATGSSAIGQTATFTVNTTQLAGIVFGTPGNIYLGSVFGGTGFACPCTLNVDNATFVQSPLTLAIPLNLSLVGLPFAAQGYGAGSICFGAINLTNSITMTLR
ncbi:MAG: hypothetical protein ACK6D1_02815 [Planctomycetota bacterium]